MFYTKEISIQRSNNYFRKEKMESQTNDNTPKAVRILFSPTSETLFQKMTKDLNIKQKLVRQDLGYHIKDQFVAHLSGWTSNITAKIGSHSNKITFQLKKHNFFTSMEIKESEHIIHIFKVKLKSLSSILILKYQLTKLLEQHKRRNDDFLFFIQIEREYEELSNTKLQHTLHYDNNWIILNSIFNLVKGNETVLIINKRNKLVKSPMTIVDQIISKTKMAHVFDAIVNILDNGQNHDLTKLLYHHREKLSGEIEQIKTTRSYSEENLVINAPIENIIQEDNVYDVD